MVNSPAPVDRRAVLVGGLALAAAPLPVAAPVRIERLSPLLDRWIAPDAVAQPIATGIRWAEGPAWVPAARALFFSDPPANALYRWQPGSAAARPYLTPSGAGGTDPSRVREPGSNGLAPAPGGDALLVANSGGRSIDRLDLAGRRTVLVDRYRGKRFNSPNDLTVARGGAIYFTDPPYGLVDDDRSPLRELGINGVYRWAPGGEAVLIDGTLTRPNGIALSPDGRRLYVSVSDEHAPRIMAYTLDARGLPTDARVFVDAATWRGPGLPDGMKVAADGTIFCSAPGGYYLLTPEGEPMARIADGGPIANCCFGEGGRTLFLTANHRVLRLPLRRDATRA